jgi:hypothetical protein
MFGTIKSLIPEPRQADQPRRYVGRHRHLDVVPGLDTSPGLVPGSDAALVPGSDAALVPDEEPVSVGVEQQTA